MNTISKTFTLALCLTAVAATAFADTVKFGPNNTNYRVGNGGEFNLIPNGGASDPDGLLANYDSKAILGTGANTGFETFCIQYGEHINFGSTYEYQISTFALGPTGKDEVSQGTAWLYSQFAQGLLGGYNYTPGSGRAASAGNLQNAIWYLEDEIALSASAILANPFLTGANGALTFFGNKANAQQNALGAYGVFALNLDPVADTGTRDWNAQDQLVYRGHGVPDGGATIAFLGFALLGLAGIRQKFFRAK